MGPSTHWRSQFCKSSLPKVRNSYFGSSWVFLPYSLGQYGPANQGRASNLIPYLIALSCSGTISALSFRWDKQMLAASSFCRANCIGEGSMSWPFSYAKFCHATDTIEGQCCIGRDSEERQAKEYLLNCVNYCSYDIIVTSMNMISSAQWETKISLKK
jgi:hypothetical protein